MRIAWQRSSVLYRMLVVVQTIGWAVSALAKVVLRQPRWSLAVGPVALTLTSLSITILVAGLVVYAAGRNSPDLDSRRGMITLTWGCLQVAGALALVGYVITGGAICFGAGMVTLVLMHVFSPNHVGRDSR